MILWAMLIGVVAQLIDGTMGMGFGLTSSTLLLSIGAGAAVTSAAVHIAEVATTLVSGASHWYYKNVDWRIFRALAIPGAIGAFAGAVLLSNLSTAVASDWISILLLLMGLLLIARTLTFKIPAPTKQAGRRLLLPLGAVGGFIDATGGGGWGPVVTPTLLTVTGSQPRQIIGTVSASEFLVALSASVGFLIALPWDTIGWEVVLGLAIGGALAAPIAARIVAQFPRRVLGLLVGITVVVINAYRLLA